MWPVVEISSVLRICCSSSALDRCACCIAISMSRQYVQWLGLSSTCRMRHIEPKNLPFNVYEESISLTTQPKRSERKVRWSAVPQMWTIWKLSSDRPSKTIREDFFSFLFCELSLQKYQSVELGFLGGTSSFFLFSYCWTSLLDSEPEIGVGPKNLFFFFRKPSWVN